MLYPSDAFGKEDGLGGRKTTIQSLKPGVEIRQETQLIIISFVSRGSDTKTKLSTVDVVELARAYQPKTGNECDFSSIVCNCRDAPSFQKNSFFFTLLKRCHMLHFQLSYAVHRAS